MLIAKDDAQYWEKVLRISSWDRIPKIAGLMPIAQLSPDMNLMLYKSTIKNMKQAIESLISLLDSVEQHQIRYFGMDISDEEKHVMAKRSGAYAQSSDKIRELRHEHMIDEIKDVCDSTRKGIFVLAGAAHHQMANEFKSKGYPVAEFSIFNSEMTNVNAFDPGHQGSRMSYLLRGTCTECKEYQKAHHVQNIDLHVTPLGSAGSIVMKAIGDLQVNDEL